MTSEINIDLSNYKDRVGARVEPGRYHVLVEDAEVDKSKAGNDMVNLWLTCVEGEFEGATVIDRLTQSPGALFRTVMFMQAIGLPTPKKKLRINLSQFIGKHLLVDVDDGEPYNGRVKSEVRGYMRLDGGAGGGGSTLDLEDLVTEEPGEAVLGGLAEYAEPEIERDDSTEIDLESVELR